MLTKLGVEGQEEPGEPFVAVLDHPVAEAAESAKIALAGCGEQGDEKIEIVDVFVSPVVDAEGAGGEGFPAFAAAVTLDIAGGFCGELAVFPIPGRIMGVLILEPAALRVGAVTWRGFFVRIRFFGVRKRRKGLLK